MPFKKQIAFSYETEIPFHLHPTDKCDISSNISVVPIDSDVDEDWIWNFAKDANGPVIPANLSSEIDLRSIESLPSILNGRLMEEVLYLVPSDPERSNSDADCQVAIVTNDLNNALFAKMTTPTEFANAMAKMSNSEPQKQMSNVKLRVRNCVIKLLKL